MPRLLGVDIPDNKKIEYALRYVYGIGPTRAVKLLAVTGIDPNARAHTLSEEQLNKIAEAVTELGYRIEGDLRRELIANLKRLQAVRSLRGVRHQRGLPVRGQRTKTNARTRKGAKAKKGSVKK